MAPASSNNTNTTYPSINILGAGIAGLTLACHLRRRRIPYTLFDAASKPKGHTYGITISSWGYADLLPSLEQKLSTQTFRELIAVDKLSGGKGITTAGKDNSVNSNDDIRASDRSLRNLLARDHTILWNHKVVSAERVSEGLKLNFENGTDSTAVITIDAGGERSGLTELLLPDLTPEVLPYAVYHGSKYITQSVFDSKFSDIFRNGSNVLYVPPQATTSSSSEETTWHLQLAKSQVTIDDVPSKIKPTISTTSAKDPIIELRYTFSRPSLSPSDPNTDPLYNPDRAKNEATKIPSEFYTEITNYLSHLSTSAILPDGINAGAIASLLDPESLKGDRVLNWLMRVKTQAVTPENLRVLASQTVVAIGDAVHACPPLCSEGATLAMDDARAVADWVETDCQESTVGQMEERTARFYGSRVKVWEGANGAAKERLSKIHESRSAAFSGQGERSSGRI